MKKIWILTLIVSFGLSVASTVHAQTSSEVLIKNATVLTAVNGTLEGADILVRNGKIAALGKNLKAGAGAKIVDASGKFVTPGIIDAHSHSMLDAINEGSYSVTSMTNVRWVLNPSDISV